MAVTAMTVDEGVRLGVETYGAPSDPTILLLGGATSSMDWWQPELCERLAEPGRHVVRYDHRDTGISTSWPAGEPGYTGDDLALDPLRLLDALGVRAAHLVGVSMGGGIAQDLAGRCPDRVLSMTLVATSCAFERRDQTPLPPMEQRVRDLLEPDAAADPTIDEEDLDAVVEEQVRVQRVFAGSLFDEERTRETARLVVERTADFRASITNHWVVIGGEGEGPRRTMADLDVPTLVVHGTEDPMFPLPHGEALALEIAGARLLVVEGMGHEVPPRPTWDLVVPAIHALTTQDR